MEAKAPPTITYYDSAQRERIRAAIRCYAQENRVGAPKLRDLIADANGLSRRKDGADPIALSTVQRFLADTHRVNDGFVRLCARFVAGLPDADANPSLKPDPVRAFGDLFAAFLGVWRDGRDCRPVPPDMRGAFQSYAFAALPPGEIMRVRRSGDPSNLVPFSRLRIEVEPGHVIATVFETITNWRALPPDASGTERETMPRRSYEGVMIHPNGALVAVMRNVLTGTPRISWLDRRADNTVLGYGHESYSALDTPTPGGSPLHSSTTLVLRPVEDEP